ncbi:hypothetical protein V6N11_039257 [Hibiscus sabdariffa]|uniref:Transposase MuDR plant domain-containing protein n=1 Tax=Hibiscus sabdariffa TaxID=183260 RepID=A0ABR2SMQ9_9ROSI
MGESIYVLQYFHGGKFRTTPKFEYVNGLIEKFQVDPDILCICDILGNVELLGYGQHNFFYYMDPNSDFNCDGLVLIHNEEIVRQVIQLLVTKGIVDIYVDHKVEEDGSPKVNDDTKVNVEGAVIEALETDIEGLEVGAVDDDDDGPMGDADDGPIGDVDGPMEDTDGFDLDDGPMEDTGGVKEAADGDDGGPSAAAGADGGPNVDSDSDSTTEDENDEESFLHNIEITSDVDEELDNIRRNMKNSKRRRKTVVDEGNEDTDDAMVGDDVVDEIESKENDGKLEGNESEYLDSSDPGEYGGSDVSEAEVCGTFVGQKTVGPRYDPNCSIPTWELGMRFEDNLQFKEAVRKYSVANGVKLNFVKNEPNRTRVCCKGNCPWLIFASHESRYDCYVLKTYNPIHKCYRSNKNILISCKMIEKKFKDMILSNPKMKVSILQEMCQSELGAYEIYNMCQRAKKNVLKEKNGSYVEEFASLWGYDAELIASNPGSTVTIQVDRDSVGIATFHRIASQPHEPISIGQTHVTKSTTVPSGSQKTHVHRPRTRSMSFTGNESNNSNHGQPSNKRKRMTGIGLYTNLRTGEQIYNSGLGFQTTVTPPTNSPKKIGASTSQFDHTWKGPGLSWKGKKAVSTRQVQQELFDASRKHPQIRMTQ